MFLQEKKASPLSRTCGPVAPQKNSRFPYLFVKAEGRIMLMI